MKKRKQSWRKDYKPLKLYKDDLAEMINIVKKRSESIESDFKKLIVICIDEFEIDDAAELDEIGKDTINYFRVSLMDFCLSLSKDSASLCVDDNQDTSLMGIANQFNEILRKRQRRLSFLFSKARFIIGVLVIFLIQFILGFFVAWKSAPFYWIIILAVISVCVVLKIVDIDSQYATIIMSNSGEVRSFFKRNKDKILTGAVAGSIVTVFLMMLLQWVLKLVKNK